MLYSIGIWALAGILVPLGFLSLAWIEGGTLGPQELAIQLWPSGILLFALEGMHRSLSPVFLTGLSVILNVPVYATVGAIVRVFGPLHRERVRPLQPTPPSTDGVLLSKSISEDRASHGAHARCVRGSSKRPNGEKAFVLVELGVATALIGSFGLLLLSIGTNQTRSAIVGGTIGSILLIRRRPVYPFGSLFARHPAAAWADSTHAAFATALEKGRDWCYGWLALAWFGYVLGVAAFAIVRPPYLAQVYEYYWGGTLPLLFATAVGLAGTAAVSWLAIHFVTRARGI